MYVNQKYIKLSNKINSKSGDFAQLGDFANSTEGDRNSNASGYVTRIVNAYRNNEINSDGLSNLLTKYNEENNGNVKIIPGVLSGNGTLEYNVSVGNTQYQLQRTTILDKPQN